MCSFGGGSSVQLWRQGPGAHTGAGCRRAAGVPTKLHGSCPAHLPDSPMTWLQQVQPKKASSACPPHLLTCGSMSVLVIALRTGACTWNTVWWKSV